MTDRWRDRSLQACSKGHDNLKSTRYGTGVGRGVPAGRCLSQGFPPRAASFVFPFPLVGPPTKWAGSAARIGLVAAFLFSAKFICMGKRPNRLTAIQTKNRTSQFFRTWSFFFLLPLPRLPCTYPGAPAATQGRHPGPPTRQNARIRWPAAATGLPWSAYPGATYPAGRREKADTHALRRPTLHPDTQQPLPAVLRSVRPFLARLRPRFLIPTGGRGVMARRR
jgi:hypothetical protein